MGQGSNMDTITLRMVTSIGERGLLHMICLETDIIVAATDWDSLHQKMRDATLLYLQSFSREELERGSYVRLAPLKYRIRWSVGVVLSRLLRFLSGPIEAIYDPQSSNLRFA